MTREVRMRAALDDGWHDVDRVSVGSQGDRAEEPQRYVTVTDGDRRVLRVDVHMDRSGSHAFEDAILWRDLVVIGCGAQAHAIRVSDRSVVSIQLASYFAGLYPTADYLLLASGIGLRCIEPDRSLRWANDDLGLDGVVVHQAGIETVQGEGEWDPPGGWRPFALSTSDGRPRSRA